MSGKEKAIKSKKGAKEKKKGEKPSKELGSEVTKKLDEHLLCYGPVFICNLSPGNF